MNDERRTAFFKPATWHGSLEEAEQLLAAHPDPFPAVMMKWMCCCKLPEKDSNAIIFLAE